jgi:Fic family protein
VLLSPLTTQEAVLSSRIEGTQATIGEVLQYEAAGAPDELPERKREDIEEVLNYRRAMRQAVERMNDLPLCNRLIRELHGTLMSGVRGDDKSPGDFRGIQNYIAAPGRTIEQARFIPIAPGHLQDGMNRWEDYIHGPELDVLVQLAIVHAEFEALHPFLDGNGRIGRMLIPLFLYDRKLLREPMFYMSEYLEANRPEYYDRLLAVSSDNDWTGWSEFFLRAVEQQASQNEAKARQILALYDQHKSWIVTESRSTTVILALDFIFSNPIFNATKFIESLGLSSPYGRRILGTLAEHGLLTTIRESSGRRPAVYAFGELLNITEGRVIL